MLTDNERRNLEHLLADIQRFCAEEGLLLWAMCFIPSSARELDVPEAVAVLDTLSSTSAAGGLSRAAAAVLDSLAGVVVYEIGRPEGRGVIRPPGAETGPEPPGADVEVKN